MTRERLEQIKKSHVYPYNVGSSGQLTQLEEAELIEALEEAWACIERLEKKQVKGAKQCSAD